MLEPSNSIAKRPSTAAPSLSRVDELDGVRGLAVTFVVMFHFFADDPALPAALRGVLSWGWSGVDLFFVLSGFLVGRITAATGDAKSLRAFYARRALRILPLLYVAVAAQYVMFEVIPRTPAPDPFPYVAYLLLVNDFAAAITHSMGKFAVVWSLAMEEKFYLLSPWIARTGRVRRWFVVLALLALSVARQGYLFHHFAGDPPTYHYLFRWEGLCLGSLLAFSAERLAKPSSRLIAALVAAFLSALTFAVLVDKSSLLWGSTRFLSISAIYASAVALTIQLQGTPFVAPLRARAIRWIGSVSYGVYLTHQSVHTAVGRATRSLLDARAHDPRTLIGVVSCGATLALAAASWRWFEAPIMRYAHRTFRYR